MRFIVHVPILTSLLALAGGGLMHSQSAELPGGFNAVMASDAGTVVGGSCVRIGYIPQNCAEDPNGGDECFTKSGWFNTGIPAASGLDPKLTQCLVPGESPPETHDCGHFHKNCTADTPPIGGDI